MTREEVKEFVNSQLESSDCESDFFELDSLTKLELIMQCENEFLITIDDVGVEREHDWNTDKFVDYIMEKINKKE